MGLCVNVCVCKHVVELVIENNAKVTDQAPISFEHDPV